MPGYAYTCYLKYSDAGAYSAPGHYSGQVCDKRLVFGVQGGIKAIPAGYSQVGGRGLARQKCALTFTCTFPLALCAGGHAGPGH